MNNKVIQQKLKCRPLHSSVNYSQQNYSLVASQRKERKSIQISEDKVLSPLNRYFPLNENENTPQDFQNQLRKHKNNKKDRL